jgi:hypothetical protein
MRLTLPLWQFVFCEHPAIANQLAGWNARLARDIENVVVSTDIQCKE